MDFPQYFFSDAAVALFESPADLFQTQLEAEMVALRKKHLDNLAAALNTIPKVTDVAVFGEKTGFDGALSFKNAGFTFKYDGHDVRAELSNTGYSMGCKLNGAWTAQSKSAKNIEAGLKKLLK